MKNLFAILKKPNRLDEFAAGDNKDKPWFWNNVRSQITILHCLGIFYVIAVCLLTAFTSIALGIPVVFPDSPQSQFIARIIMVYICFSIISNFLMVNFFAKKSYFGPGTAKNGLPLCNNSSAVNHNMTQQDYNSSAENEYLKSGWKKCSHCNINVPPRTRHCSICQICVLKKDHHCFFTGCCIGFHNQRFFIVYCFIGIVGGTWGLYNYASYLGLTYAPVISLQIYKYFLPYCMLSWIFGYSSYYEMCLVLLLYMQITSTATTYYYFIWQWILITRGQTSYDFMKRKRIFSNDFWYNVHSIFGRYWFVCFVIPLPFVTNQGDGISWRMNSKTM